jgi:hypothetical protein
MPRHSSVGRDTHDPPGVASRRGLAGAAMVWPVALFDVETDGVRHPWRAVVMSALWATVDVVEEVKTMDLDRLNNLEPLTTQELLTLGEAIWHECMAPLKHIVAELERRRQQGGTDAQRS